MSLNRTPLAAARLGLASLAVAAAAALAGCGSATGVPPSDQGTLARAQAGYAPAPPTGLSAIPPGQVAVVGLTHAAAVKPGTLAVASDGTLEQLSWSSWGGPSATAMGTLDALICTTNCATGHHVRYRADVVLSDPVTCAKRRYYNVATTTISTAAGTRRWGSFLHAPCTPQPLVYR